MADAKRELVRSKRNIQQMPADLITEQVIQLVDALEEELAREEVAESVGGDIASQLAQVVTQDHQTDMTIAMSTVRLMALEWDIDHDGALQLFELG